MVRSLIVAVQFLTRLPTPQLVDFRADDLPRAAKLFPAVGILIGMMLLAVFSLFSLIGAAVAAFATVALWVLVTGALHADGLADVADAMGAAHRDPDRFIAVLRDPHLGSFGVIALVLLVVGKFALLQEFERQAGLSMGLVLVPAWARWSALCVSRWVPPLVSGSGAKFSLGVSDAAVGINFVLLVVVSLVVSPVLILAPLVAAASVLYWRGTIGGVTGDCLGATIEVTELVLLLALVVAAAIGHA